MSIVAAGAATPVTIPTLAMPPWVWVALLVVFALLAVGLGMEAVKGGHVALMLISLVVGIALGGGAVALLFTNMLRGASVDALRQLEERHQVWIHPQRDDMFAVPVLPNSSAPVAVRTQQGQALDCVIVSDDISYSLFCKQDGALVPIESIIEVPE